MRNGEPWLEEEERLPSGEPRLGSVKRREGEVSALLVGGALLEGGGRQQGRGVVSRSKEAQSRDCLAGAKRIPIGVVVEKMLGMSSTNVRSSLEWRARGSDAAKEPFRALAFGAVLLFVSGKR